MDIDVLLFAGLTEHFAQSRITVTLNPRASVHDILPQLTKRCPAAAALIACSSIAVNEIVTHDNITLKTGDVVALLPPVSGG
jgi:MoaE-MoaD fusion protein